MQRVIPYLLSNCTSDQLNQIHGFLVTSSLAQNPNLSSLLLRRITELRPMAQAELIFSSADPPHVLHWNAMIRGYSHTGPFENALKLFEEMPLRNLEPNSFTYPYLFHACSRLGDSRTGKKAHCHVIKVGFDLVPSVGLALFNFYIKLESSNLFNARIIFDGLATKSIGLWNRMLSEYVRAGDVGSARRVFDDMPERDVVSWNSMLSGYARGTDVESAKDVFRRMPEKNVVSWTTMVGALAGIGDLRAAKRLFDEMPERNVVSWNCMLSGYTQNGRFQQALHLFFRMQAEGVVPDGFTLVPALSACAHTGALGTGKWIHHHLIGVGLQSTAKVGTALVEMYAKCGDMHRALNIFVKMIEKDVFSWNVMIKALAVHGRSEDAVRLFEAMKWKGIQLNDFTFMGVLFACSHGGLVEEGRRIFSSMESDFKVKPKMEHYGCLIDLLCRNGRLEDANRVMMEMPYEPDIVAWGALLGGCKVTNDLELAERVMERVAESNSDESGVYVLASNMYAASDRWNDAAKAREKMEQNSAWKTKGCSSVLEAAE
ncbi:pentatricopeptide repeat-containing protein [Iris pallida]|uniref:Pentatricopeptide repeat-containing protein n=1 Tax=Iris pallida TaxID=29817 RepID=A0AAX6GXY6_IRIPA|nr:pentatricopeptide repeat-containing protein [Iris pallida]